MDTTYLQRAVTALREAGHHVPDTLLAHIWPLAWDHINIAGDYSWNAPLPDGFRPLRWEKIKAQTAMRLAA